MKKQRKIYYLITVTNHFLIAFGAAKIVKTIQNMQNGHKKGGFFKFPPTDIRQ